ncbi:MAG: DUF6575 domain-containing protein [Selenomonadaceae bacterium]
MSNKIKIIPQRVLVFYDNPEVFIGIDQVDSKYICILAEVERDSLRYLCCPVSTKRLINICNGEIDLHNALKAPETNFFYYTTTDNDSISYATMVDIKNIPDNHIPAPGFIINTFDDSSDISEESLSKNRPIIHFGIEETQDCNVSVSILSETLSLYQKLVKYAYSNFLRQIKEKSNISLFHGSDNYLLKAFASSPGSFIIHLESFSERTMFNYNIENALEIIDQILYDSFDREKVLPVLKMNAGHFISTLSEFSRTAINKDITIKYQWTSPLRQKPVIRRIPNNYFHNLSALLNETNNLEIEMRTFEGKVIKADTKTNNWKIVDNDGFEYSGTSIVSLAGITLDTVIYTFNCEESIEGIEVTGKERITYKLISYSPT